MPRKIEISHKTIIFSVLLLIGLWFLYFIREIILQLFVALLLMSILEPLVSLLAKIKIPRVISVLVSYIIFFGILAGVISLIIPPLVDQTTNFVRALPSYLSNIGVAEAVSNSISSEFILKLSSLPTEVIKFAFSVFGNFISVITVLVFSFYMLLGRGKLESSLGFFFGDARKKEVGDFISGLEEKLGGWARGQLLLMLIVGVMTYLGLLLLRVPFAIPLALLAGLLEIIPFLGPVIAAIPSLIIGFGINPAMGIGVLIVAFAVQQIENYLLVPKIMEKSVGVSPMVTLIALAIGEKLAGVTGMIISVPTFIAIQAIFKRYFFKD